MVSLDLDKPSFNLLPLAPSKGTFAARPSVFFGSFVCSFVESNNNFYTVFVNLSTNNITIDSRIQGNMFTKYSETPSKFIAWTAPRESIIGDVYLASPFRRERVYSFSITDTSSYSSVDFPYTSQGKNAFIMGYVDEGSNLVQIDISGTNPVVKSSIKVSASNTLTNDNLAASSSFLLLLNNGFEHTSICKFTYN